MSILISALPVPSGASVAQWGDKFGIDKTSEWLQWANSISRPESRGVHVVAASVAELVAGGSLDVVRWPVDALAVALPSVLALRMVGAAYPKNGKPGALDGLPSAFWTAGYVPFLHVEAGAAPFGGSALWSWPEQVVMLSNANELWSAADTFFAADTHLDLLERLDQLGLLDECPVLIDYVLKKRLNNAPGKKQRMRNKTNSITRRNKAQKIMDRAELAEPGYSVMQGNKYFAELPGVQLWRDVAQAQADYWEGTY